MTSLTGIKFHQTIDILITLLIIMEAIIEQGNILWIIKIYIYSHCTIYKFINYFAVISVIVVRSLLL